LTLLSGCHGLRKHQQVHTIDLCERGSSNPGGRHRGWQCY
jgi:hypothetical protein